MTDPKLKLISKLKSLVEQAKLEKWNGGFIRRVKTPDGWDSKIFQVNKRKFKIELHLEVTCDNQTHFVPTPITYYLTDCRVGRGYNTIEKIAEYLNLSITEVEDIYQPMIKDVLFQSSDIEENKEMYNNAMKRFREDFCL